MEQVDGADLSRARRLELQDQVREHTSTVLQALEAVLVGCVAESSVGGGSGGPVLENGVNGGGSVGCDGAQGGTGSGVREGLRIEASGIGAAGCGGAGGAAEEVVLAALDCLKEWAKLGVSLGGMATDRPLLLDRLVRLVAGEGGPGGGGAAALPTACAACEVMTELVAVREYPRPAARAAAAEAILGAMGKLPGLFAAAIQ
ncbi:unnamed protein product, partial [Sphacelaria rigidula]